ncbi:MAG: hypothetical protein ACI82I_000292 [Gammaproteobacteria bacterium]|jgi:hypothetical protein
MTQEFPLSMVFAPFLASFFSAPSMIIGGLAGWFSGAGKHSQFIALSFVFLSPLVLFLLVSKLVDPMGQRFILEVDTAAGLTNLQLMVGAYVGTVLAMLLLYIPLRSARKAWREHKSLLEAAK